MRASTVIRLGVVLALAQAQPLFAAPKPAPTSAKKAAKDAGKPAAAKSAEEPKDKSAEAKSKAGGNRSEESPAEASAIKKVDVQAAAAAMEAGYGKLFEGVKTDEQKRTVLRFAGHDFLYDDGKTKTADERIDEPDMEDMFEQVYPLTNPTEKVEKDFDPGRARVEEFFKLLYGATEKEVSANLKTVDFCGTKVRFNAKCGAAEALAEVAKELDTLIGKQPGVKIFTQELGGTFQWRTIAGTKRLSNHSFGTAIDLNVKKSAYWRWSKPETLATFSRKDWPTELVEIFERHSFVWGGKWWHYDTMHFEYRPELVAFAKAAGRAKASPPPEDPEPAKPEPPKEPEPTAKPPLKGSDLLQPLQEAK